MAKTERVYRRTAAGQEAWEIQNPAVPLEYRRILGLIKDDAHTDLLQSSLQGYSDAEIAEVLAELEKRGLLQSEERAAREDLDFTGNFTLAECLGSRNRLITR